MKYIEYLYLAVALFGIAFLASKWELYIENGSYVTLGFGIFAIIASAFMYNFRRTQRRLQEKAQKEEIKRMEASIRDEPYDSPTP